MLVIVEVKKAFDSYLLNAKEGRYLYQHVINLTIGFSYCDDGGFVGCIRHT